MIEPQIGLNVYTKKEEEQVNKIYMLFVMHFGWYLGLHFGFLLRMVFQMVFLMHFRFSDWRSKKKNEAGSMGPCGIALY